jgi:hypothetical protein
MIGRQWSELLLDKVSSSEEWGLLNSEDFDTLKIAAGTVMKI